MNSKAKSLASTGRQAALAVPLVLAVAGCGGGGDDSGTVAATPPPVPTAVDCAALASAAGLPNATTVITATTFNAATATVAEHCQVNGAINQRTGVDGQSYAIKFRLRLPTAWNGRLYMSGGGGINGSVVDPVNTTVQGTTLLSLGYATLGTDSGHDNAVDNNPAAGGTASFGVDPQARTDFGFNSYDQTVQAGKALIARYFRKGPDRSYFVGCSEGGREAMVMSQRFPTYFDGIVAGDPGFHLPLAAMAGAQVSQVFANVARAQNLTDANGKPAINKTYSDPDLMLVRGAVLSACDALDGLADGIVDDIPACTPALVDPQLAALQCTGAKTDACLSSDQIVALQAAMAGPKNSQGIALYNSWPWDAGISGQSGATFNQGWRSWWLGSFASATNNSTKLVLAGAALPLDFIAPPAIVPTSGIVDYMLAFDLDTDAPKIYQRSGIYSQSPAQFMFADSTSLSVFRDRGGKMIMYHGGSDTSFSVKDTIDYYDALDSTNAGKAAEFVRLFVVPGMNHCSGGPATDRFDALTPLVDWVEKGVAPDSIVATASNPGYFGVAARTRPLCPYPKQTRYKGSGDINLASNFTCQ
jgi:feruloyl esterase